MPKRGRPFIELNAALTLLEELLKRGPIRVSELQQSMPVSMRTLCKAKKRMNLQAVKTKQGWFWKNRDMFAITPAEAIEYAKAKPYPSANPAPVAEPEEPEERERCTTADLIHMAEFRRMEDIHTLLADAYITCAAYPQPHSYSKEYIESVIRHVIDGTPIRTDLNKNTN